MKKFNKIFSMSLAAMLVAGLFSCVEEAPEYVGGEADIKDCPGAFFPTQEAAGDHTFDPTMERTLNLTISRTDSVVLNEISVPVAITADSKGIYVVNGTPIDSATVVNITMPKGAKEVTFPITFEKAETAVKYNLSAQITDNNYASIYNVEPKSINLSVFCVEWNWFKTEDGKDKALFTFNQVWWGETHQFYLKYYEVDGVRHCVTVSEPCTYEDGSVGLGIWGTGADYELEFVWYTETNYIFIPYQSIGYKNGDDGYIFACCEAGFYEKYRGASYYTSRGYESALDWLVKNYPDEVSYYDGNGTFELFTYYVCDQDNPALNGRGYSFGTDESMIADGFTRVDYSIEAQAAETTAEGVVPVSFTLGADVDTVKYVVAEGKLNDAAVKKMVTAITEDKAENVKVLDDMENPAIAVSADSTGIYTLVAVSYAKGEAKENTSVSFTFVAPEDKDAYTAVISVGTEATSAMYEHIGYTNVNSFEFFVYGQDLTSVKLGFFKTSMVKSSELSAIVSKCTEVDEETLELINGAGYADILTGLDALTSYTVVAVGSNGYNTQVGMAEFTTDGLPLEPFATGTYTYVQMLEGDDSGLVLSVDPNYENTYAISNWFYGVDFKFTWDKETNLLHVLEQPTGYYAANYGEDVYVCEFSDYAGEGESSYAEGNVLNFNVVYFISLGTFGYGWEKFVIDESDPSNVRAVRLNTNDFTKQSNGKKPTRLAGITPERDPQGVAVKAVKAEKVSGRNMSAKKVDLKVAF